jgi:hypothetical protein
MPNVLALSLGVSHLTTPGLYNDLLPKLLTRAAVHEARTLEDAHRCIDAGWPSIILCTDTFITEPKDESRVLLDKVSIHTKNGCTTVLMGCFPSTVDFNLLGPFLRNNFELRWRPTRWISLRSALQQGYPTPLSKPTDQWDKPCSLDRSSRTPSWRCTNGRICLPYYHS